MKEILGANPCPIQVPIGAEETFKGVVDLISMQALVWHDETMGAEYTRGEIPANMLAECEEWRDKMLESIAEFDDDLMTKYFDDPSTITEEEIKRALRNATLQMKIVPMLCGSSFKNKGVQTLLDAVCAYLHSSRHQLGVLSGKESFYFSLAVGSQYTLFVSGRFALYEFQKHSILCGKPVVNSLEETIQPPLPMPCATATTWSSSTPPAGSMWTRS